MLSLVCRVTNQKGMHARAAAKIVELTLGYRSKVTLSHQGRSAPSDSLIKLLTLNAPQGSLVEIDVDGVDESDCLRALNNLFSDGFGE